MHAGGVTFNATFYGVLVLYRPEPSAASAHEEVGNALGQGICDIGSGSSGAKSGWGGGGDHLPGRGSKANVPTTRVEG
jgi:hypothetical protein